MKKLFALSVVVMCGITCIAQNTTTPAAKKLQAKQFVSRLLSEQTNRDKPAAKTTVTSQRLIGQSDYNPSPYSILDSFAFKYNGGRGSIYDAGRWGFLVALGPSFYPFTDVFGFNGNNGIVFPHNQAPLVRCDTTDTWSRYPITPFTYGHFSRESHTYDVNNNLIDNTFIGDPGIICRREVATYNSLSNITSVIEIEGDNSVTPIAWDTMYRSVFTYNSSNKMILDSLCDYDMSTASWVPQTKYIYTYDVSGNLTLAQGWAWNFPGWSLETIYTMTYNSANQLQTFLNQPYAPGAIPAFSDSFGYTTGIAYPVYNNYKEYTSGTLSDMTITTMHITASGLPDTVHSDEYFTMSSPYIRGMTVTTYNSYNNPTIAVNYVDTTTVMPTTVFMKTYYYYELYEASGIDKTIAAKDDIKIFPNPSTGTIFISQPAFMKNNVSQITISNAAGQKLRSEAIPWQKETEAISMDGLLPGVYIITIQNTDGSILHTEKVVKI